MKISRVIIAGAVLVPVLLTFALYRKSIAKASATAFHAIRAMGKIQSPPAIAKNADTDGACEDASLSDTAHAACLLQTLVATSKIGPEDDNVEFPNPIIDGQPSPWFTKCDIGLEICTPNQAGNLLDPAIFENLCGSSGGNTNLAEFQLSPSKNTWIANLYHRTRSELIMKGLDLPEQSSSAMERFYARQKKHLAATEEIPPGTWASVLYNKQAACSIARIFKQQGSLQGILDSQTTINGEIDPGSIVVKTMWETVTVDDTAFGASEPVPLVDSGIYDELDPENGRLQGLGEWYRHNHEIVIKTGDQSPCSAQAENEKSLPITCFSYIDIQNYQNTNELTQTAKDVLFANQPGATSENPSYIVLVGINIMHKTMAFPNWRWSAYSWSKEVNNSNPIQNLSPWMHFTACEVTAPRPQDVSMHSDPNVCFNPYLEGIDTSVPNGVVSNCLTCHAFAAYGQNLNKNVAVSGIGTCFGSPAANSEQSVENPGCAGLQAGSGGAPPLGIGASCGEELERYCSSTLNTHFLWSLGDMQTGAQQQAKK